MAGTEFRQVVDHPRTDGYGHGIGLGKHGIQLPDIRPFGIEFRVGEDVWFILRDTRSGQYLMHVDRRPRAMYWHRPRQAPAYPGKVF